MYLKMKNYKIIIIDQERTMQKFKGLLEHEGLIISSSRPDNGRSSASSINELVRFDIMLPEECIIPISQKIQGTTPPPFFMLTARIDNTDQLAQIEKGVRDNIDSLIYPAPAGNHYKAELTPKRKLARDGKLVAGPISINVRTHGVSVFGFEIHLTPIEFKILRYLVSNPEKVITRQELVTGLHGPDIEDRYRSVDCHIARIRKKISRHIHGQNVIRTVYGTGYAFRIPEPN